MTGKSCAVFSCKNSEFTRKSTGGKIMFHRFPRPIDVQSKCIMKEWINGCQRSDKFNPDTHRICSVHFTENDYERDLQHELLGRPLRRILKKTAVPTMHLFDENLKTKTITSRNKRDSIRSKQKVVGVSTIARPSVSKSSVFKATNYCGKEMPATCSAKATEEIPQEHNYKEKYKESVKKYNKIETNYSFLQTNERNKFKEALMQNLQSEMEVELQNNDVPNRPELKCKLCVLTRPDGSSLFCEGESAVIAALYGPVEVKMQKVLIDKASVECIYRPKAGFPGVQDKFRESLIRNICETALAASLYPRAAVLVNIQEMQNRGQLISCAINAACLACLDSGVDMKFVFGAVSCFLTKTEEFSLLPPLNEENVKGMFVFVFNNTTGSIIASYTEGCFSTQQYQKALDLCREESKNVFSFIKKSLLNVDKL